MSTQTTLSPYKAPEASTSDSIDLIDLLHILRRHAATGAFIGAVLFVGILWFYFQQDTIYRAQSTVIIDLRSQDLIRMDANAPSINPNQEFVETESKIIASRNTARAVVDRLELMDRDYFQPRESSPSPLSRLIGFLSPTNEAAEAQDAAPMTEEKKLERVIDQLLWNLRVERQGDSFAMNVNYDATDPLLAAEISNAFSEVYVNSHFTDRYAQSADANSKLSNRLSQLAAQVEKAETEVEEFRKEKGLIEAGGSLLDDQEVNNLQAQLAQAETDLASVRAEYETAALLNAQRGSIDEMSAALDSPIINNLRSQYLVTQREVSTLQERYKSGHPELQRAENDLAEIKSSINEELSRIVGSLRSDLDIAEKRVSDLRYRARVAQSRIRINQAEQVELRELERKAEAAAVIYEDFLTRLNAIEAQDGFEQSEARIISPAIAPENPVAPKKTLGVALAASLSMAGALIAIAFAELLVGGIRSGNGLTAVTGAPCVVSLPKGRLLHSATQLGKRKPSWSYLRNIHVLHDDLLERMSKKPDSEMGHSVAFCSPTTKDGRTEAALALSQLSASLGAKTLIVQFELTRNVFLSHISKASEGMVPQFKDDIDLNVDVVNAGEGLPDVLSISIDNTQAGNRLTSQSVNEIIRQLVKRYELVVFDVPPLLDSAEASWFARSVDTAYLTIAARKTPTKAIDACLQLINRGDTNISGSILTGVDPKMIA